MPCIYSKVLVRKTKDDKGNEYKNFYIQETVTITRRVNINMSKDLRAKFEAVLDSFVESGQPVPLQVSDLGSKDYTDKKGNKRTEQFYWLEDLPE